VPSCIVYVYDMTYIYAASAKLFYVEPGQCWDGQPSKCVTSRPCQLSLAIPPWVGAMSKLKVNVALALQWPCVADSDGYISTYKLTAIEKEMRTLSSYLYLYIAVTAVNARCHGLQSTMSPRFIRKSARELRSVSVINLMTQIYNCSVIYRVMLSKCTRSHCRHP